MQKFKKALLTSPALTVRMENKYFFLLFIP